MIVFFRSGKTTFAKKLQQYCQGEELKMDDCRLISFDAIEAEEDLGKTKFHHRLYRYSVVLTYYYCMNELLTVLE